MNVKQWLINGNPRGRPLQLDDFTAHETQFDDLQDGRIRVRVEYLSFDPSQKGQMENISGYSSGQALGDIMVARGIGEVIESRVQDVPVGARVVGPVGWQEVADLEAGTFEVVENDDLLTARLGVLGSTGLTAYFGLLRVGQPQPGDVVLVSGAAGGVGSVVGQIAKLMSCEVIGTAGGPSKCAWLTDELGFDATIDYKAERIKHRLSELAPGGINVFFDNVGGVALNDALTRIATGARVVICGGISRYGEARPDGPTNYFNIVFRQATMAGFLLSGYEREYPEARRRLSGWIRDGKLVHREDIQHGFENAPATLIRLFTGANMGKQLLKL